MAPKALARCRCGASELATDGIPGELAVDTRRRILQPGRHCHLECRSLAAGERVGGLQQHRRVRQRQPGGEAIMVHRSPTMLLQPGPVADRGPNLPVLPDRLAAHQASGKPTATDDWQEELLSRPEPSDHAPSSRNASLILYNEIQSISHDTWNVPADGLDYDQAK